MFLRPLRWWFTTGVQGHWEFQYPRRYTTDSIFTDVFTPRGRSFMKRIPEPQIMSPTEEAQQYHEMDHGEVNRKFVTELTAGPVGERIIDLGCGPAAIPIEICRRLDSVRVMALDQEVEMLEIAKREIDLAGLLDRIELHCVDAANMSDFDDEIADVVVSNSLIHHLDQPELGVETAVRLLRAGGRLFVRDLFRPGSMDEVEALVRQYAGSENELAQQLFRQSFQAALTLEEIREIARGLHIDAEHVQMSSDRHWTIDWIKN